MSEAEELEPDHEEQLAAVTDYINHANGEIMDGNAEAMKVLRDDIEQHLKFQGRMNQIFDAITEAMAAGALMMSGLHYDMMAKEFADWDVDVAAGVARHFGSEDEDDTEDTD